MKTFASSFLFYLVISILFFLRDIRLVCVFFIPIHTLNWFKFRLLWLFILVKLFCFLRFQVFDYHLFYFDSLSYIHDSFCLVFSLKFFLFQFDWHILKSIMSMFYAVFIHKLLIRIDYFFSLNLTSIYWIILNNFKKLRSLSSGLW